MQHNSQNKNYAHSNPAMSKPLETNYHIPIIFGVLTLFLSHENFELHPSHCVGVGLGDISFP